MDAEVFEYIDRSQWDDRYNEDEDEQASESSSGNNRWDEDILNEVECKQIFVDERAGCDNDENIPEFFDVNIVERKRN